MNKNKLYQLVKKEAENLKVHATQEEIAQLDLEYLEPNYKESCVYGLMTGHCESKRATELIVQCCERVYKAEAARIHATMEVAILNGKPKIETRVSYFSPIEVYIGLPGQKVNGNNKNLIDFLKGETNTLTFNK